MRKEHQENDDARDLLTIEQVEEVVRERMLIAGMIKPTAIVEGKRSRQLIVLDDLGETPDDRTLTMMTMGYDVGRSAAVGPLLQLTFIAEAWLTTGKSSDALIPPSEDPQRKECVVIAQTGLEAQSTAIRLLEIVRDRTDEFHMLLPLDTGPASPETLDSPLINAFLYGYWLGSDAPRPQSIH